MVRRSTRLAGKRELEAEEEVKQEEKPNKKVTKQTKKVKIPKGDEEEHDVKQSNGSSKSSEKAAVPVSAPSTKLEVGDKISDLELLNQDSEPVKLTDVAAKKPILVIFAYPKASTPGCTRQAKGFGKNYEELKKYATVVGLSADSPNAQKNFISKQSLPYDLLSDPSREFIGLLGAKKQPKGVVRSHWIFVDGKLKVSQVGISPEKSVQSAYDQVLELAGK
ncbi:hypothetical protein LJB42_000296 [Komagataella kurtzmanii]|nr:hypothetical protein LJB42_000296 [Komagataella kurtzmanii]